MTLSQATLEKAYTSKDGSLTNYSIAKLSTSGKLALMRLNKHSDNGLSLTVCDIASTEFTSIVSAAATEKGVQPIKIATGSPILIDFNVKAKDSKDKPSEEIPLCLTMVDFLRAKNIADGQIFFASLDMMSIPLKGWSKKELKNRLADEDFEENPFYVRTFDLVNTDSEKPDASSFEAIIDEFGYSFENWKTAYEKIDGSKFVEKQQYQKVPFSTSLVTRMTEIKAINSETRNEILSMTGYLDADNDTRNAQWAILCESWLKSV